MNYQTTRRTFLKTSAKQAIATGLFASLPMVAIRGMEQKNTRGFSYSCSSVNYMSLSLEEACEHIAAQGFDSIDIWDSVEGYLDCPHLKVAQELGPDRLKALLDKNRLKLAGFTVYIAKYPQYAELLSQCGGDVAVRSSRPRQHDNLVEDMKQFFEELKPEIELCEKYDSYLAIENHGGDMLLNDLESIKTFIELNPSKHIGIALAPYHIMNNGESVTDAIRICGKQLLFIYFWTNEKEEKQLPGIGQTDVTDWFEALREIGYSRPITPFMHDQPEPAKMDELHRQSREYLDRING